MAYSWTHDGVHTRQHRSSTEPAPQPPFSTIPPSLIPGRRHRQTISTTTTAPNGIPYSTPGDGIHPVPRVPASFLPDSGIPGYHTMNPSLYRDFQPPPLPPLPLLPLSLPLPQSQSSVLPRLQQPEGPPLPPKTPINTSPSVSPTVPPKLPPFVPPPFVPPPFVPPPLVPPPPTLVRPKPSSRSQSQPPPPKLRSTQSLLPPPPIPPPPRPRGARSYSVKVTSSTFQHSYTTPIVNPGPSTHLGPSIKPSSSTKGSPSIDETPLPPTSSVASLTSTALTSTVDQHLGINEEEELELALALSAHTEREHANSLLSQDEEFARALEQSLLDSPPKPVHARIQPGPSVADDDNVPSSSSMNSWDEHSHSSKQSSHAPSPVLAPSPADVQLKEDEALARRLEAQYESERASPSTEEIVEPNPSGSSLLPRYPDVMNKETAVEHHRSHEVAPPQAQRVSPSPSPVPADERLTVPDLPRTSPSPSQRSSPRPESLAMPTSPEEEEAPETPSSSPQSSRALMTPNQYVEPELLYGVSFGFNTPPTQDFEMQSPLPNIIALPYGKSPPMHIRAQSWRQLLKLMAKLGATQVEPSVEAVSLTKGELQLRTVIQFFKVHSNSSDWRIAIYLTIDYPPPPEQRFITSVDVNALPYSYRLSTLPAMLRDGPDSAISKYYTIPATTRTPWPQLPITMPNMAMYLMAALEDSRRALGDSSSGLRRLAKMIDQYYPNQQNQGPVGEEERRRGGRALFGRLMGRSTKPQGGGRNADVYDLVTPFVSDEWG